eukprot:gene4207-5185_t
MRRSQQDVYDEDGFLKDDDMDEIVSQKTSSPLGSARSSVRRREHAGGADGGATSAGCKGAASMPVGLMGELVEAGVNHGRCDGLAVEWVILEHLLIALCAVGAEVASDSGGKLVAAAPPPKTPESETQSELRDVALLEVAVYCAPVRHGAVCWEVHGPARKLLHCLNRVSSSSQPPNFTEAVVLARRATSALGAVIRASGEEVLRLAFWWSNVVVLRAMLAEDSSTSMKPLLETVVEQLLLMERSTFDKIMCYSWGKEIVKRLQYDRCQHINSSAAALGYWKEAMGAVLEGLCPRRMEGESCGCLPDLSNQVMTACMEWLDVLMLNAYLGWELRAPSKPPPGTSQDDLDAERRDTDPQASVSERAMARLLPDCGVEANSPLTFGTGMRLKLFVGDLSDELDKMRRRSQAIATQSGAPSSLLRQDSRRMEYFPRMRAVADMLMLPKSNLADPEIRRHVCPNLTPSMIKRLLESFRADEHSAETIPATLFSALDAASAAARVMTARPSDATKPGQASETWCQLPKASYTSPTPSLVYKCCGIPAGRIGGSGPSAKRQRQSQAGDSKSSAQRSINLDNNGATIRSLIAKGEIDAQDKTGHTLLFWAVQTGDLDLARELLEGGARMEAAADTNNWTCLHQAALLGEANMVDLLLLHGAQATARDSSDGRTPMHIALAHSPHPDQGVLLKLASAGGANMVMHDK